MITIPDTLVGATRLALVIPYGCVNICVIYPLKCPVCLSVSPPEPPERLRNPPGSLRTPPEPLPPTRTPAPSSRAVCVPPEPLHLLQRSYALSEPLRPISSTLYHCLQFAVYFHSLSCNPPPPLCTASRKCRCPRFHPLTTVSAWEKRLPWLTPPPSSPVYNYHDKRIGCWVGGWVGTG
jgi:hypothetical protein